MMLRLHQGEQTEGHMKIGEIVLSANQHGHMHIMPVVLFLWRIKQPACYHERSRSGAGVQHQINYTIQATGLS